MLLRRVERNPLHESAPCRAFPLRSPQYRNVNMSPSKHASYLRLLALKSCFWQADEVRQHI